MILEYPVSPSSESLPKPRFRFKVSFGVVELTSGNIFFFALLATSKGFIKLSFDVLGCTGSFSVAISIKLLPGRILGLAGKFF